MSSDGASDPHLQPDRVIPDCARLFVELRRVLGDEWFVAARTLSFQVSERGDVVLHTGKGISFLYGADESADRLLAIDRNRDPAVLSLVHSDGRFEEVGPVEIS